MFIQTETTADPATLRFLPGRAVTGSGTAAFADIAAAARSPLAERLFAADGVAAVELGPDYVSVTRGTADDWQDLKPGILRAIMEHFLENKPVLLSGAASGNGADAEDAEDEMSAQIRELVESRIQPAASQSGGEVVFRAFEDGIVVLDLQGPAVALKPAIQNMLQHYVPEVTGVRSLDEHERLKSPAMNTPEALAVRSLLDEEVNPAIASHGGHISLIDIKNDIVYVRLEGGCQGCGMADVTLKQGVEEAVKRTLPSITAVLDVTDHAGGSNPYFQPGKGGASPA